MHTEPKLTDEQWDLVAPILSKPRRETRGRKRRSDKALFEAALYFIANSNVSWRSLPIDTYPPYQSCFRQFKEWDSRYVIVPAIEALAKDLEERGGISLRECFMDELFEEETLTEPIIILDMGPMYIGGQPERSWQVVTKEFFTSNRVWCILYGSQSEWIRERTPNNLLHRIKFTL
ncbi:MAG: hypothetical protein RL538_627 [Candidatus Parcubacteria bacterium]|jgi:transposase